MAFKIIISALIAYLLGSINTSVIIGKLYSKDVRKYGSKNAGLTNTLRVLGKKAAIFVLIGDILKSIAACFISHYIISEPYLGKVIGGFFVIAGHIWPVYFKFKGGKGALSAVTVAFIIHPISGLIMLAYFILVVLISKMVSLGTILTGVIYPFISYFMTRDIYVVIYSCVIAILIIIKHKANVIRILKGKENKLKF